VEQSAKQIGMERFGAHDLRRTCAKLCRKNGGDLEQIKFLLGHSSIQTTERYLGSEQDVAVAVNDNLASFRRKIPFSPKAEQRLGRKKLAKKRKTRRG
jgi:integrase